MGFKIGILSQSHLCRNPRVLKEAVALSLNGYEVYILNAVSQANLRQQDLDLIKDYPSIHIQHISDLTRNDFQAFFDRAFYKLGCLLIQYLKIENPLALGYGTLSYLKKSKSINADLYICHQELATYIGTRLLKANYKVAFDLEDWYSADLLPAARHKRPVKLLQKVEATALNTGLFCTTTSGALANELARVYTCKKPEVIYNVFPFQAKLYGKEKKLSQPLKLFWFSQTIGPGRGIEEFIHLLKSLGNGLSLHLLGAVDPGYKQNLAILMPKQHRLFFHDLVTGEELPEKIAQFDVGLALELGDPPSRNYTITNKFFQYLQAGLPVIATETAGQKEVFDQVALGHMIPQHPAGSDMVSLEKWLNDPAAIHNARLAVETAALLYSWDTESKKLISLIKHALGPKN
jgi:glycosyltransferase involved in cell wall biosynthesis